MNQKGVTLVELLIVLVIIGIISTMAVLATSEFIRNSRESSFINTADEMLSSAESALLQGDSLWNDDKATLRELIENDYISVSSKDPWGTEYDLDNSFVTIGSTSVRTNLFYLSVNTTLASNEILEVTLVCGSAKLGFEAPVSNLDAQFIVYEEGEGSTILDGIIETITGNQNSPITGEEGNDQITISGNAYGGTQINTLAGDDTVTIDGNMTWKSYINTGSGDDSVVLNSKTLGRSSIKLGDGNDTFSVKDMQRNSSVFGENGDDQLTINWMTHSSKVYGGNGNDTIYIGGLSKSFKGTVDAGAGDDSVEILDYRDLFSGVTGTFKGGIGNDTLKLPKIDEARWNEIKHLFTGFETIILSDKTITN